MIDYSQFPRKNILCVDMKSFYASVSAVTMGLNPLINMLSCCCREYGETGKCSISCISCT